jgi:hypothetical protein
VAPADDAAAQRELTVTLERFRGDARAALGLRATDDAAAARKAFMSLCKIYHPAKFARFSPPIVKLANEVFLSIRRAYESVSTAPAPAPARAATSPGVGASAERPSGNIPRIVKFTPPTGIPVQQPPITPPAPTPHPPTPVRSPPPAPVPMRPPERPSGSIPRAATPRPATPSPSPPPRPTTPPPKPTTPPANAPNAPGGLDKALDQALALAQREKWAEARAAFVEIATRHPGDPRYRAYVHYARGWEAFSLGKDNEARAEWQRANACDPTNTLVKWALESTGVVK